MKAYFQQKRIYDDAIKASQGKVPSARDMQQAVKASFTKLYYSTNQNRQTV